MKIGFTGATSVEFIEGLLLLWFNRSSGVQIIGKNVLLKVCPVSMLNFLFSLVYCWSTMHTWHSSCRSQGSQLWSQNQLTLENNREVLSAQVPSKHLLSPQLILALSLNIDSIRLETRSKTARTERNSWGLREEPEVTGLNISLVPGGGSRSSKGCRY